MIKKIYYLIIIILLLLSSNYAFSENKWKSLKTKHFTVFYPDDFLEKADTFIRIMEYYKPYVEKISYNQDLNLPFVLEDIGILSNGFYDPIYRRIHIFTYSPEFYFGVENWLSLVGVHEYIHHLTISNTRAFMKVLNKMFGNFVLFLPNMYLPGWLIEGIAVYGESKLTPYQGRLNAGEYNAYIKSRTVDNRFPSILDATYTPFEYDMSGMYTYGSEFVKYLSKKFGEEKLGYFFKRHGGNMIPFIPMPVWGLDRYAKQAFGKSFKNLWKDWEKDCKQKYLDYKIKGDKITDHGWEIAHLEINDNNIFYTQSYSRKVNSFTYFSFNKLKVKNLLNYKEKTIKSSNSPFSSSIKIKNNNLYYSIYNSKRGYKNAYMRTFGFQALLYRMNLKTNKKKLVLKDELRAFDLIDDNTILYSKDKKDTFGSILYLYHANNKQKEEILKTDFLISEIDIFDGKIAMVARKDWENTDIYLFNINKKSFSPIIKTPFIEGDVCLNNQNLFYTANYSNNFSIYRYNFESKKVYKVLKGYALDPFYDEGNNELYFRSLNSYGYDIYKSKIVDEEFNLPNNFIQKKPELNLIEQNIKEGGYFENLKTLIPKFWLPWIDSDANEYGGMISGGDAIMHIPYYSLMLGVYDNTILDETETDKKSSLIADFYINLNIFAPLDVSLNYIKDKDEQEFLSIISYPLIYSIKNGLTDLNIGVMLRDDEDYQNIEISPFISLGIKYPLFEIDFLLYNSESKLQSDLKRNAIYLESQFRLCIYKSLLKLDFNYIDDKDNPDYVFSELRGYDYESIIRQGYLLRVDYSFPLLKIRNGFWNPNIYFEDVICNFFYETIFSKEQDDKNDQYSYGLELHIETKTLFMIQFDWGGRFVKRKHQEEDKFELFAISEF